MSRGLYQDRALNAERASELSHALLYGEGPGPEPNVQYFTILELLLGLNGICAHYDYDGSTIQAVQ